jgi:hypothetical protein
MCLALLLLESLINASSLISRIKPLQKEQFFIMSSSKSRNSNYYKTIPNGSTEFFKFFMIWNCFVFDYYSSIIFKMLQ